MIKFNQHIQYFQLKLGISNFVYYWASELSFVYIFKLEGIWNNISLRLGRMFCFMYL